MPAVQSYRSRKFEFNEKWESIRIAHDFKAITQSLIGSYTAIAEWVETILPWIVEDLSTHLLSKFRCPKFPVKVAVLRYTRPGGQDPSRSLPTLGLIIFSRREGASYEPHNISSARQQCNASKGDGTVEISRSRRRQSRIEGFYDQRGLKPDI